MNVVPLKQFKAKPAEKKPQKKSVTIHFGLPLMTMYCSNNKAYFTRDPRLIRSEEKGK